MKKLETLTRLRWELPFAWQAVKHRDWRGARSEAAMMRERLTEAVAMDIAWRLPKQVALWTFIRVYAHGQGEVGAPDPMYAQVHDAWMSR